MVSLVCCACFDMRVSLSLIQFAGSSSAAWCLFSLLVRLSGSDGRTLFLIVGWVPLDDELWSDTITCEKLGMGTA